MRKQADYWIGWMLEEAAPLWSGAGFNAPLGLFHEMLTLSGRPADPPSLRLMAQARQVASFAALGVIKEERPEWGRLALSVMARLETLYYRRDGSEGWIFAVTPKGEIADRKRDLYAHAFLLFAYASLGRFLEKTDKALFKGYRRKVLKIGREIFVLFGIEDMSGNIQKFRNWRESLPYTYEHAQNPWMHLLEACLTLFEIYGDKVWQKRAKVLLKLLRTHFLTLEGLLPERFTDAWKYSERSGKNRIEPGHLFEWCWLLGESRRLLNLKDAEKEQLQEIGEKFMSFGRKYGISDVKGGLVVNAVLETGRIADGNFRLWPQTEYIRLLVSDHHFLRPDEAVSSFMNSSHIFIKNFIPERLKGGWIDRLSAQGNGASSLMPATSFYHILSAVMAIQTAKG